ncbi:MAG TPA: aspartate kinase [Anaerolineae bacterium]|nr:aspartate kinase [Anaerolineae bacterium]
MVHVMKFGGTSVVTGEALAQVGRIVKRWLVGERPLVVVVSALGTRPIKVTDWLLRGLQAAAVGELAQAAEAKAYLEAVHLDLITNVFGETAEQAELAEQITIGLKAYDRLCEAVAVRGQISATIEAECLSLGERWSAPIVAAYLRTQGIKAEAVMGTELVVTSEDVLAATPDKALTRERVAARLGPLLAEGVVPVVTGFIGETVRGEVALLGRGGSDYSAAILGEALAATEVCIWTDVPGVMTADPRRVAVAQPIQSLSFGEVTTLALAGAKVLHPETMRPCWQANIPLRIKDTFAPERTGTLIVNDVADDRRWRAVTSYRGGAEQAVVTLVGAGQGKEAAAVAAAWQTLSEAGVTVLAQEARTDTVQAVVPVWDEDRALWAWHDLVV